MNSHRPRPEHGASAVEYAILAAAVAVAVLAAAVAVAVLAAATGLRAVVDARFAAATDRSPVHVTSTWTPQPSSPPVEDSPPPPVTHPECVDHPCD